MIVFTMHPNGYKKQCQDEPLGTYISPVPTFVGAYLDDMASEMADIGQDFEYPAVSQYVSCSPFVIENVEYYFQLGCADGTTQALAVNIYKDNTCTQRSTVDGGLDDSNIDVSEIQVGCEKMIRPRGTHWAPSMTLILLRLPHSFHSKSVMPV